MADARHRFAPVAVGALVAGAVVAIAGNQSWAVIETSEQTSSDAAFASVASAASDASAPPVTALALVLLATWGVVLVSRGRPRRAVTWLGLLAAVGALGFAVSAWITTPDTLSSAVSGDVETSRTVWSYLGVLAALAAVALSVLATRSVAAWPEMGRRYDAPGAAPAPATEAPLEEQTNLELWRAIDEGRDPTDGPTH